MKTIQPRIAKESLALGYCQTITFHFQINPTRAEADHSQRHNRRGQKVEFTQQ
jgi:hypothetical protein